jgi:Tfp pilus assembly protein PilF
MAFGARDQSSFAGRPIVNFSFAMQCGFDGKIVLWKLHLVNVLIHIINTLLIFELMCLILRTLKRDELWPWVLAGVGVWAVHPINTETVVYLTQRTELLVILFYLLTLYTAMRYCISKRVGWLIAAVVASAIGMGCKEIMVSVPIMVLLMDRTLISNRFGKAMRQHWKLYAGLGATWVIVIALNITGPRNDTAGFHLSVTPWQYLLTQSKVICLYFQQLFTGTHLSVLHDIPILHDFEQSLPYCLVPLGLLILTARGIVKNKPWSLAGGVFFLILGPTSSIIPIITEVAADRRMYLPSAALLLLLFAWAGMGLKSRPKRSSRMVLPVIAVGLIGLCLWATQQRVTIYNSKDGLWKSVLKLYPDQVEALNALGYVYIADHHFDKALKVYERAVALEPGYAESRDNLGLCYMHMGQLELALEHIRKSTELQPKLAKPHNNLGIILAKLGKPLESAAAFEQALVCDESLPAANLNLGLLQVKLKLFPQAYEHLHRALPMLDGAQQTACKLQMAIAQLGMNHPEKAVMLLREILQTHPNHAQATELLSRINKVQ